MAQQKRDSRKANGHGELIIIGGHEDKEREREVLKAVAERVNGGMLLVATLASSEAAEQWEIYRKVFQQLGVKKAEHLDLETRAESDDDDRAKLIRQARAVFFTGGDQLRITSTFGGSPLCEILRGRFAAGLLVAGTSAGASVLSETMLVSGPGDDSHRMGDALRMAPGLGLTKDFTVDQHFAQRGRLSRLVGAVAQNPRILGVGIDEDTAIVAREGVGFEVIGNGAVYVIDGRSITYTNLSDSKTDDVISVHNVKLGHSQPRRPLRSRQEDSYSPVRRANRPATAPTSTVILIGGAEEKTGERTILREIAQRTHHAPLAICTAGSVVPDELFEAYRSAFRDLGVNNLVHVAVKQREDADDAGRIAAVAHSKAFFFGGGDQLRITSVLAGSRLYDAICDLYRQGGTVAGTSAGASALGHTMPLSTAADEHKISAAWQLVPGLALLDGVIVDQHFAQRGRMGRLVAGVVENPRLLGLGIDENTGVVWTRNSCTVIGSGAVYIVDGRQVTQSNLRSARPAIGYFGLRYPSARSQCGGLLRYGRPPPRNVNGA